MRPVGGRHAYGLRRDALPGDAIGDSEHLASHRLKANLDGQQAG